MFSVENLFSDAIVVGKHLNFEIKTSNFQTDKKELLIMIVGVLKEQAFEPRVSLVPETIAQLAKMNVKVLVERDAGEKAFFGNTLYSDAGATLCNKDEIIQQADVVLTIHANNIPETIKPKTVVLGAFQPLSHPQKMQQLADKGITSFSLDSIPRTTRAQAMDVLSSQANIAGYKAVLLAAFQYSRYFPMFMTAAGSIAPARVLILGAGVAGLQAIATARRLGAVVEVFDTRPAVKEEVMSLGAKFVEVEGAADASKAGGYAVEQSEEFQQRQKAKIHEHARKADIIITTAQIPGKKAPILISKAMLEDMRPGSVVIDLAAATGGNTDLTENEKAIEHQGITIVGNSALAASMPSDASKLYSKNVFNFLKLIINKEGGLSLNWEDDLVVGTCISHDNKVMNERVLNLLPEKLNA